MSEDPKLFDAGDYNLFRYCHNDPIDNVDPMGLEENLAQKPISAWDPTGRAWLKQLHDAVQEMLRRAARERAYARAYSGGNYEGGTAYIGMANFHMAQVGERASSSPASSVSPSNVRMIDREDSFSPSEWSDRQYNLRWRVTHDGNTVNAGAINGITPRAAYAQSGQIGFATAAGMTPGQSVTYNFVRYTSGGFVRSGWSVSATVIDPWGIQREALQTRIGLQNSGVIPAGVNLRVGGGLSSFLYGQLPAFLQYNGYYYATGGH